MNKVDIYINGFRLDLFDDEEITINLSVQNVQDISKVFTDFTQGFTVPATAWNNAIFQHYYRSDIDSSTLTKKTILNGESLFLDYKFRVLKDSGRLEAEGCCADALDELGGSLTSTTTAVTFDGRLRQAARIEINSLPFRTGVVEVENVQLKGTEPYAYTITFYGDVVTLSDLFGDDYLYDIEFPAEYNHNYTDTAVFERLTTDTYAPVFYPMMSPVDNWYYNSDSGAKDDPNLHYKGINEDHGIHFYELKPALKVTAILDAIEAKYGITFTGSFLSATPFVDLSLWLHRFEGYLFGGGNDIAWQLINFNTLTSGSDFNLATDTWTVAADGTFTVTVGMTNVNVDYEVGLFANGQQIGSYKKSAHPSTTAFGVLSNVVAYQGQTIQLFIRPQNIVNSLTYRCSFYDAVDATPTTRFLVSQSTSATYTFEVVIQDLMPEIKVKDFLGGILKMYNMVIQPTSATSFLLQPLDDWYAAGTDQDYQTYFDITEYTVNRPPLYREIEFKYQETEQILGYQYQRLSNQGFGDLRAFFSFDGDEFIVDVPFECPLFERLTDIYTGSLTNVLVYKSITSEANEDGKFNPYLGAPVLFYGYFDNYDLTANSVAFVNSDNATSREVTVAWYANTSNRYASAGASHSICFGADIDPYHLQSVNRSLYSTEWSNYITDLYNKGRRLIQIDAVLPVGKILTMNLKNAVIWNNEKYIVNSVQLNMTTGKATFELLNVV
jgi:hypothetical protein